MCVHDSISLFTIEEIVLGKRVTQKEADLRVQEYLNKFDLIYEGYDEFKGSKTKLKFECKKCTHRWDTTTLTKLSSSKGCIKCTKKRLADYYKDTYESFLTKANKLHQCKYFYPEEYNYINAHHKIDIGCPEHGSFTQTINAHLNGTGCPSCAKIQRPITKSMKFSEFLNKARVTHGNFYDYSEESFKYARDTVEIICKEHGTFKQKVYNHINGNGCPSCAEFGYDKNSPAYIYLVKWGSGEDTFCKVGITNNKPCRRISQQSSKTFYKPLHTEDFYHEDGNYIRSLEQEIKQTFKCGVISKDLFPDGFTETVSLEDYTPILKLIKTRMET